MSSAKVRPPEFLKASDFRFEYRQRTSPATSNLDGLSFGTYRVAPGSASEELHHRREEALLFSLEGLPAVELGGKTCLLKHYDVLYVPVGMPYRLLNEAPAEALLAVCRAPATKAYLPHHAPWEQVRLDERRVRRLPGKDVYLMFDVSERAEKLMAGYTLFRPSARSWPPHNHTDQEEIYVFTRGRGSMEVYAEEETKTFVRAVGPLDGVTIPLLNYHPVFSQEEELDFIWCIAGERYWVGDRHKAFMDGSVDRLTT